MSGGATSGERAGAFPARAAYVTVSPDSVQAHTRARSSPMSSRTTRPRASIRPVAGVLLCALLLMPGRAHAQLTPAQKQEVREHYDKAVRAYDIQKFGEAIEEYQKTYEISGDPAMLFNVAQAYRLNGQPQEAVFYYRRYLERSPLAPN